MNRYIYVFTLLAISLGTIWCFQPLREAEIADRNLVDGRNSRRVPLRDGVPLRDEVPLRDGVPVLELIGGATVRILDADRNPIGLGVTLDRSGDEKFRVLTASHLIPVDGEVFVERRLASDRGGMSGTLYSLGPVIVIANDPDRDLALLEILSSLRPARQVAVADAGADVDPHVQVETGAPDANPSKNVAHTAAWGNEDERPRVAEVTIIAAKSAVRSGSVESRQVNAIEYWQVEQASEQGMSGGGLFNAAGQLIGIASGNSGGTAYFVHLSEIAEFLQP